MSENIQQTGRQGNGHYLARDAAQQANEVLRRSAQAAQQSNQAASEAVTLAGNVTAQVTQRGREVSAEAMRRIGDAASETFRQNAEIFAGAQRDFVRRTAERFEQASHQMAQATQATVGDLRALITMPSVTGDGLQDIQRSMTGLIEGVVRTNLQAAQDIRQLANSSAFVALQQRFVRGYLEALMQGTSTFVRATRYAADETLRRLDQQIKQHQQNANEQPRNAAQ